MWLDARKQDMKVKTKRAFDTVCELASKAPRPSTLTASARGRPAGHGVGPRAFTKLPRSTPRHRPRRRHSPSARGNLGRLPAHGGSQAPHQGLGAIQIHSSGRVIVSFSFTRTVAGNRWRGMSASGSGLQATPIR